MPNLTFAPTSLLISEIFGPTIQGEGRNAGAPAIFVRTAHCNVHCDWCDTRYSWDWRTSRPHDEVIRMDLADVWRQARHLDPGGTKRLVVTGGEPALQWSAVAALAAIAVADGWKVELETSGTRPLGPEVSLFDVVTVAPKLRNAGVQEARRQLDDSVMAIAGLPNVIAKFVIADPSEVNEIRTIVEHFGFHEVYLMPLAQTPVELATGLAQLVGLATTTGYRVTPRLQVLCWPEQRGH